MGKQLSRKYNSTSDFYSNVLRNNQNIIELLTKLDQVITSTDSFITASTTDATGKQTISQLPSIGSLKSQLDQVQKSLQILSGVDGNPSSLQIANNQFKRIVTADLNLEPKLIPNLNPVTTFVTDPNWIFDNMLNPKISIQVDLTDKIAEDTRTIQAKRFIVEFDRQIVIDENGNQTTELTDLGQARKAEFETKYKGKSNIDMVEFVQWLDTIGLINRVDDTLVDQDFYRVDPNRLQTKGLFTVLNTEIDTINKKLWYVLDTLTYYDISDINNNPKPIELKVGDLVNVNPNVKDVKSTTVYRVAEISTITSEYRVRFEVVFGLEPIPVRLAALSIYSQTIPKRTAKISIGYDEYNVVFLRQVDDNNNLIGLDWSAGIGFYTNELKLNNENGQNFSEYYVKTVYDYGMILDDLVKKKVPNYYGIKPNAPVLNIDNFKVVQTNAHLTNSIDAEQIRDLHNQKNNLTSQIQQLSAALETQQQIIQTTQFNSQTDQQRAQNDLVLLTNKLSVANQSKFSVVQNILASEKNLNKIAPEYHVRGFFPIPEAKVSLDTMPQEVVQFQIWYRKLSKSGSENPILTISGINNTAAQTSSADNTLSNPNIQTNSLINGAFSNWTKYLTDSRKRVQDLNSGDWYWEIVDVSNADTPNINQIDIDIQPGEVIEFKVKSLSEVGWPDSSIESDFSNVIQVPFPDDLNNVLTNDQFILSEAQQDDLKISMQQDLDNKGLTRHLNSAILTNDLYYAHQSKDIASGFLDNNGNIINLYDQLNILLSKISSLEEVVNRAKGILEVYIVQNGNRTLVSNGSNYTFNLNLEDGYLNQTQIGSSLLPFTNSNSRTYANELLEINDFSIIIKNTADTANLGLLSYRIYGTKGGQTPSAFAYDGGSDDNTGSLSTTWSVQSLWLKPDASINSSRITENQGLNYENQAPYIATQQDKQWLWQQLKDSDGNYIVKASHANNRWTNVYNAYNHDDGNKNPIPYLEGRGNSQMHNILITNDKNIGFGLNDNDGTFPNQPILGDTIVNPLDPTESGAIANAQFYSFKITDAMNWSTGENEHYADAPSSFETNFFGAFATTIHPQITDFRDIVDSNQQGLHLIKPGELNLVNIPIKIYAKPYTGTTIFNGGVGSPPNNGVIDYDFELTGIGYGTTNTGGSNKMNITILNHNQTNSFKVFGSNVTSVNYLFTDYILLQGIQGPSASLLNNKLHKVWYNGTASSGSYHTVTAGGSYVLPLSIDPDLTSGLDLTNATAILVKQRRGTKGTNNSPGSGAELVSYQCYPRNIANTANYIVINSSTSPQPQVHTKKLRFYLEDESSVRPFEFQMTWNITQYRPVKSTISGIQGPVGGGQGNN